MPERAYFPLLLALALALAPACGSEDPAPEDRSFHYPDDDRLRLNQIQVKASHNSYHVERPGNTIPDLAYTHQPLDVQLRSQGVRGFELDLYWDAADEDLAVYHIPVIDQETTCNKLVDCLRVLRAWSDANPAHHALIVQIEANPDGDLAVQPDQYFAAFDAALLAAWPRERIVTPDDVRGSSPTLREALTTRGWPTLGETRGKVLFFVDNDEDGPNQFRGAYTRGGQNLDGRLAFIDSAAGAPYEAVHVYNEPIPLADKIADALAAGFVVRTRADDTADPPSDERRAAALASGAQLVSTDFPAKLDGRDYVVEIPGGKPSRCNPMTAPADCEPEMIENPAFIR
jgi:hypothetical protein